MPEDSAKPTLCAASVRPVSSSTLSTRSLIRLSVKPCRRAWNCRFSTQVCRSHRVRSSAAMNPTMRRTFGKRVVTSKPSMLASPVVGVVSPVRTRNRVDLPAPLGPTTAQILPRVHLERHIIEGNDR